MPSSTKTRSGNPAKRAAAAEAAAVDPSSKYAPSAWGSGGGTLHVDLECPSGQVCLVRRPGLEGLMKAGILHNLDTLTPIIDKHREKVKGRKPKDVDVSEILEDPKKLEEVLHLMDRVAVHCVVQPPLQMTPNDPTRREPGVIYCDMVELEDKMFILNYVVGGSSDLATFRRESEAALGGVLPAEADADEAE